MSAVRKRLLNLITDPLTHCFCLAGGRNGYGAKLCNIFSTKFTVETQCNEYKKAFKQTWNNNMGKSTDPKIVPAKGEDYTCVTFYPDLKRFGMETLSRDTVDLFTRRAYDIAAASRGVKVFLNGKKLPVSHQSRSKSMA